MPPPRDSSSDLCGLREFGLALARDDHFICDAASAEALVEQLCRQASITAVQNYSRGASFGGAPSTSRLRAFAQFVRLYRRHIRRLAADDSDVGWDDGRSAPVTAAPIGVVAAVRSLPYELREALLLVALARFSHEQAAQALDISFPALLDRLVRARERLSALTMAFTESGGGAVERRGAAHLRVVK